MIKISAVLSIHNRSKLFRRALDSYLWQTMPRGEWEIILLDDMSTEDLSKTYEHLHGHANIRHVRVDHRKHPYWKMRNPGGQQGDFENWFHTPAITINLGSYLARGTVICLCHPEVMHAPWNFDNVWKRMTSAPAFLFGKTHLGTLRMNAWMDKNPCWYGDGWNGFLQNVQGVEHLGCFGPTELYWYTSFLPKRAVEQVGGVDFEYLHGVAAEDDDFRDRVALAGCLPVYFPEAEGFHQDHSDEKEKHRQRDQRPWQEGLERNRKTYFDRRNAKAYPQPANQGLDWTGKECLLSITDVKINAETTSTGHLG